MKRIVTGLLLAVVISYIVLLGPREGFIAALAVIGALAFREFARLGAAHGLSVNPWLAPFVGLAVMLVPAGADTLLIVILTAFAAMAGGLRVSDLKLSLPSSAAFLLGICYIFGSWRYAIALRDQQIWLLFFALALNWVGDTSALYVGKAIGRHKLAPSVSPAKTWEGSAGSVAGSIIFGFALFHYQAPAVEWWKVLLLSAAGNIAGQTGDLVESAIKRGAGMKDSGTMLPGHGGWLDRIDSSLFAIPVVYTLIRLLGVH